MLITRKEMEMETYQINHKFTGLQTGKHDNGKTKNVHMWISGKRHGTWKYWYDDGDELYVLQYLNNALEGEGLMFAYD